MTIQDIYQILDDYAPCSQQESYDNSGLLVGDPEQEVRTILLTLDITIPVIEEAVQKHADLILSHHPVIWNPLRSVSPAHPVWHLIRHGIGAICSHTCFDIARCDEKEPHSLNDALGSRLRKTIPMQEQNDPFVQLSGNRVLGKAADLNPYGYYIAELGVNKRCLDLGKLTVYGDFFVRKKQPRKVFQLKTEGVVFYVQIHITAVPSED